MLWILSLVHWQSTGITFVASCFLLEKPLSDLCPVVLFLPNYYRFCEQLWRHCHVTRSIWAVFTSANLIGFLFTCTASLGATAPIRRAFVPRDQRALDAWRPRAGVHWGPGHVRAGVGTPDTGTGSDRWVALWEGWWSQGDRAHFSMGALVSHERAVRRKRTIQGMSRTHFFPVCPCSCDFHWRSAK